MSLLSVYTTTDDLNISSLNNGYSVIAIDASLKNIDIMFPEFVAQGITYIIIRIDASPNLVRLLSNQLPINGFNIINYPVGSSGTFISTNSGWFSY